MPLYCSPVPPFIVSLECLRECVDSIAMASKSAESAAIKAWHVSLLDSFR